MIHDKCGSTIVNIKEVRVQQVIDPLPSSTGKFSIKQINFRNDAQNLDNNYKLMCSKCETEIKKQSEVLVCCHSCGNFYPVDHLEIISGHILCSGDKTKGCLKRLVLDPKKSTKLSNWFKFLGK